MSTPEQDTVKANGPKPTSAPAEPTPEGTQPEIGEAGEETGGRPDVAAEPTPEPAAEPKPADVEPAEPKPADVEPAETAAPEPEAGAATEQSESAEPAEAPEPDTTELELDAPNATLGAPNVALGAQASEVAEPKAAGAEVTVPSEGTDSEGIPAVGADSEDAGVEDAGVEDAGPEDPGVEDAGADSEDSDETSTSSRLPDLAEDEALHSALEALLLVVDSPAEVEALADALDQPVKRIRAALKTMAEQYHAQNRGIDLRDVGGGWRFYTRDKYAPFVEKLLHDGQRAKLTRAALESLAVIAYRQPVTRARVAAVRGVNVDGVIRTLLARGLIEETGTDKDTGGILYRTTELFLERLGLSSLEDLPPIAPLLPEVDAIDDV